MCYKGKQGKRIQRCPKPQEYKLIWSSPLLPIMKSIMNQKEKNQLTSLWTWICSFIHPTVRLKWFTLLPSSPKACSWWERRVWKNKSSFKRMILSIFLLLSSKWSQITLWRRLEGSMNSRLNASNFRREEVPRQLENTRKEVPRVAKVPRREAASNLAVVSIFLPRIMCLYLWGGLGWRVNWGLLSGKVF